MSRQKSKLNQLATRVEQLEALADEVYSLAERMCKGEAVQPELATKGEQWYRGTRELLVSNNFSGIRAFDDCYEYKVGTHGGRAFADIGTFIQTGVNPYHAGKGGFYGSEDEYFGSFTGFFTKARALLRSLSDEILSRELPIVSQLSFAVVSDEFDTAESLLNASTDESIIRASGVIARVALERHLHVVIENNNLSIILSSPAKKKAEASDLVITLNKNNLITDVQKSQLEFLFKVGNNCAHPKEKVDKEDVKKLIDGGRNLAAVII